MAIFGFYYPRELTNWYVDDWITKVYSPGNVLMLPGWEVTRFTDDTPGRAVPPPVYRYIVPVRQTLEGPFSVKSKPVFATEATLCIILQVLQDRIR